MIFLSGVLKNKPQLFFDVRGFMKLTIVTTEMLWITLDGVFIFIFVVIIAVVTTVVVVLSE